LEYVYDIAIFQAGLFYARCLAGVRRSTVFPVVMHGMVFSCSSLLV